MKRGGLSSLTNQRNTINNRAESYWTWYVIESGGEGVIIGQKVGRKGEINLLGIINSLINSCFEGVVRDSQRYVNYRYIAESHRLSSCQVIARIINVQRAFGYLSWNQLITTIRSRGSPVLPFEEGGQI